jgi:ADP-ribosylglycohydrolase
MSLSPYGSWGNGAAMRVSPIAWAFDSLQEVLDQAKKSAEVTHNHPEGIKGAQATAAAVFLARAKKAKQEIKEYVERTFGYDLGEPVDELREHYAFDVSCQGTVPPAMIAFLASKDYEDAVRLAISLGGDSDTLACITGGIAHAFYGDVPHHVKEPVLDMLEMRLKNVVVDFCSKFGCG